MCAALRKAHALKDIRYAVTDRRCGGEGEVDNTERHAQTAGSLLCDELTGALDTKSSLGVLQAVQTLNDRYHTTVVIITHNAAISGMADRIIQIKDGKIQSNEVNANKVSPMELVL